MNPHFPVKDFADKIAFLVFSDPGFVLVGIVAAERVEGSFGHVVGGGGFVVGGGEEFPGTEVAVVHAVEDLLAISRGGGWARLNGVIGAGDMRRKGEGKRGNIQRTCLSRQR